MPPPPKKQVKVSADQPTSKELSVPGVTFGVQQGQPPMSMTESPDGSAAVGVGMPSIGDALQALSVGAPGAPQQATPSVQSIPFSQFYAMTKGSPELAEQLCPGVTSPDGFKQLVPGPDGQVHVPVAPDQQQTAQQLLANPAVRTKAQEAANRKRIDQIFALSAQRRAEEKDSASSQPQWIDTQTLARQLGLQDESQLTAQILHSIYPGIEHEGGRYPWVHADGQRDLVINPQWKGYNRYRNDVARRPAAEAYDDSSGSMR